MAGASAGTIIVTRASDSTLLLEIDTPAAATGFFKVPVPTNEPILSYAPGTKERELLQAALKEARSKVLDIPMYIGSEEVRSGKTAKLTPPHDHQHILGHYHQGDKSHVEAAIKAALETKTA